MQPPILTNIVVFVAICTLKPQAGVTQIVLSQYQEISLRMVRYAPKHRRDFIIIYIFKCMCAITWYIQDITATQKMYGTESFITNNPNSSQPTC